MKISALARKNSQQSLNVILMIVLASMLICTVSNLGFSAQKQLVDNIIEFTGDSQVAFSDISEEQAAQASVRKEVELADLHLYLWGLGFDDYELSNDIRLTHSSGLGHVANFKLTDGRPPEAANEAAIAPHLAELLGIEPVVGQEFEIHFRELYRDGKPTERELVSMRFIVSGVVQEQRIYEAADYYEMFVSKAFAEQVGYERQLHLRFQPRYNPYSTARSIAEDIGLDEAYVRFNESYLKANLNDPRVMAFVAVALLILGAAGALVIYNAYNISVVKRVHQYGLLTVIGAAKKQIRRCIYLEALFCTGVGLPIGLFAGTLMGYICLTAISGLSNSPTPYYLSLTAYLLSSAVTIGMVFIGVRRPAKKASRIAPVEAVRFTGTDEKVVKRALLTDVTLNSLARINLIRTRGRTVGTVLSLSISGILFLGFSTVAFSILDSADDNIRQIVYADIQLTAGRYGIVQNDPDPLKPEMVEEIQGLDGVQKTITIMRQGLCKVFKNPNGEDYPENCGDVGGLDPEALQEIIDQVYDGNVTLADFEDPRNVIAVIPSDYLIDFYTREYGKNYKEVFLSPYAVGKMLNYTLTDSAGLIIDSTAELKIIGLVRSNEIRQLMYSYSVYPSLYTLQDSFKSLGWDSYYDRVLLDVDDATHDDVLLAVEQLCGNSPDINLESSKRLVEEMIRQFTAMIAIVFLMLGVVALNGVMNLIGSTVMGIEQRKKELGVLMAVGLSQKAIGRMLTREGLWISLFCSALSVVFGLSLGIGLYHLLIYSGADYMHFVFPVWPIVSLCIVLGFVPYMVTLLAARGLRRATIVELLGRWG